MSHLDPKEVVWGECRTPAAGLFLGAIGGGLGRQVRKRVGALRDADDIYRIDLREVQDVPSLRKKAVGLYQTARRESVIMTAIKWTSVGATLVGIYQPGDCIAEQW